MPKAFGNWMLDILCIALLTDGALNIEDKRIFINITEADYRAQFFRLEDSRLLGVINGKLFLGTDEEYIETVCEIQKDFEKEMEKLK